MPPAHMGAHLIKPPSFTTKPPISTAMVSPPRISGFPTMVPSISGNKMNFFALKICRTPSNQLRNMKFKSAERGLMRLLCTLQAERLQSAENQWTESLEAIRSVECSSLTFNKKTREISTLSIFDKPIETRESYTLNPVTSTSLRKKHDEFQILKYALVTESAMKNIIEDNTLLFVVDMHANKANIKDAFEMIFNVRTKKVNTSTNFRGTKKAFITLTQDNNALDVAKKIKII